jgi:hypothetical protein
MKKKGRKACFPEAGCNSFVRRSPMLLLRIASISGL